MIAPEAFTPWTFNGFVSSQLFESGNGLSYTSQALVCLKANGSHEDNDPRVIQFLQAIARCEITRGLYSRYGLPRIESTSVDDLISLASGDLWTARGIRDYLKLTWGFYDATAPGQKWNWSTWMYRFPGLTAHLDYASLSKPNAFLRLAWAVSFWITARKPRTVQDSWMQASLMLWAYEHSGQKTWLCDRAASYWKRNAPNSIGELFGEYSGFPDHPLALYWPVV